MDRKLPDTVLIINFGGQYAHLISRRFRELGAYTEIIPYKLLKKKLINGLPNHVKAIVLSGGPSSVYDGQHRINEYHHILELKVPVSIIGTGSDVHQVIDRRKELGLLS